MMMAHVGEEDDHKDDSSSSVYLQQQQQQQDVVERGTTTTTRMGSSDSSSISSDIEQQQPGGGGGGWLFSTTPNNNILPKSTNNIDELLASKLNSFSFEDRSNGLEDVHGVFFGATTTMSEKESEETNPTILQTKLSQVNQILDDIMTFQTILPNHSRSSSSEKEEDSSSSNNKNNSNNNPNSIDNINMEAYQKACLLSYDEYVDKIKILCLRSTNYDCHEASKLVLRFFERKLELFGPNCLSRDIIQDDFISTRGSEEDERNLLKQGMIQLLPHRDTSGRAILFVDGNVIQSTSSSSAASTESVMRILFYMSMNALQDIETQKNGVVIVYYGVGCCNTTTTTTKTSNSTTTTTTTHDHDGNHQPSTSTPYYRTTSLNRAKEYYRNWKSTPWKTPAFHYCTDSSKTHYHSIVAFLQFFQKSTVCRTRVHTGTDLECIYNLNTYAITRHSLPVMVDGSRDLSSHRAMLKMLKAMESYHHQRHHQQQTPQQPPSSQQPPPPAAAPPPKNQNQTTIILVPSQKDVLLGSGRQPKSHPGNFRLRCLIEEHYVKYDAAKKRNEKTTISKTLLQQMKDDGSLFLLPDYDKLDGAYVECTDAVAREKIAHGFRNLRLLENKNKKQQQQQQEQQKEDRSTSKNKNINNNHNIGTEKKRKTDSHRGEESVVSCHG